MVPTVTLDQAEFTKLRHTLVFVGVWESIPQTLCDVSTVKMPRNSRIAFSSSGFGRNVPLHTRELVKPYKILVLHLREVKFMTRFVRYSLTACIVGSHPALTASHIPFESSCGHRGDFPHLPILLFQIWSAFDVHTTENVNSGSPQSADVFEIVNEVLFKFCTPAVLDICFQNVCDIVPIHSRFCKVIPRQFLARVVYIYRRCVAFNSYDRL